MHTFMVLLLALILSALGTTLWRSVTLFSDSVLATISFVKHEAAMEGLRSYAIALLIEDAKLMDSILTSGRSRMSLSWPLVKTASDGFLVVINYERVKPHEISVTISLEDSMTSISFLVSVDREQKVVTIVT